MLVSVPVLVGFNWSYLYPDVFARSSAISPVCILHMRRALTNILVISTLSPGGEAVIS